MLDRWHQLSKRAQWVIAGGVIFAALMFLGAVSNTTTSSTSSSDSTSDAIAEQAADVADGIIGNVDDTGGGSSLTSGQENALGSAESYLRTSSFSREGLINQLIYEGFSRADAVYAVDNVTVNWNEQAALSAASYLRTSSFSRQGLIDQLIYEGFSPSQARYGVSVSY